MLPIRLRYRCLISKSRTAKCTVLPLISVVMALLSSTPYLYFCSPHVPSHQLFHPQSCSLFVDHISPLYICACSSHEYFFKLHVFDTRAFCLGMVHELSYK